MKAQVDVRTGLPDIEVLAASDDPAIDLIVMATHGRGGFARAWLGSVADRVTRHATVPVLLVPGGEDDGEEAEHLQVVPLETVAPRLVIIPLDGSQLSREALRPAAALGDAFGAEYLLFRAYPPDPVIYPPPLGGLPPAVTDALAEELADIRRELEDEAACLRAAGHRVTVQVVEGESPARALLRLADAEPNAVIAMATHGRGGVGRAVLGSVADKVIRQAPCPVLLVRPTRV